MSAEKEGRKELDGETDRPGRSLPDEVWKGGRLERVGTESRPCLDNKVPLAHGSSSWGRGNNNCSLRNLAVFGITPTATAVYSPIIVFCFGSSSSPLSSSVGGRLSFLFTTFSRMLFVGTRSPGRGCENGLSGLRFSSSRESSFGALLLNALSMDDCPPREWTALLTDSGRTYPGYSME